MGKGRKNKAKSKSKNRPPPVNRVSITLSTEESATSSPEPEELSATSSTEELSTDILLFHILPRLPVHSLRRFRSLSKQCYSYISNPTPEFAKMQLHHQNQNQNQNQNHRKLLVLSETSFRTIDCESPDKEAHIDPQVNKEKDIVCVSGPYPLKVVDRYNLVAVTSFHGMVCAGITKHRKRNYDDRYSENLIIWNPVTGEYKILSKIGTHKECYDMSHGLFQLYYSSSDDDYKLLRITSYPHVYIYSLKSDSWRKVDYLIAVYIQPPYLYRVGWKPGTTALINEKLYFLDYVINRRNYTWHYSVIRFDTKTEKFTKIATPFLKEYSIGTDSLSFFVLRDCIHVCLEKYPWRITLWRMDGDGDWTKVVSAYPWFLAPLQSMRIKDWLKHSESGKDFVSPNQYASLDESPIRSIDMKKHTERSWTFLEYMETMVSPNQYTK